MPSSLKRKGSPGLEEDVDSTKRHLSENESPNHNQDEAVPNPEHHSDEAPPSSSAATDRAARFAALRARNQSSRKANLAETRTEARRAAADPSQLQSLQRKKDIAEHKLLKADVEADGEDFERKRAWDWTVEESERWDERMQEKASRKNAVGFADYRKEAGKVYDRQIREMEKGKESMEGRRDAYEREKTEAIERSVRSGGLEIVETESGELIAVDKDGSFYSTADSTASFTNKPDKAAVDRLVADIRKAEEVRLRKRRERGGRDETDGDVTYINEKNKQFNLKLARFYDKYTSEIRDSFERGTAI